MNPLKIREALYHVDHYNKQFDTFKHLAEIFIQRLNSDYKSQGVNVSAIQNNSFSFSYYGLAFLIKAEISFCKEDKIFNEGEINTYLLLQENQKLVVSYRFDSHGNINQEYTEKDFTTPYFVDFVNSVLKLSSSDDVKLQL